MNDWLRVKGLCGSIRLGKKILFDKIKGLRTQQKRTANVRISTIEALSRNYCCRGKATSITYTGCVYSLSYPACKAHAPFYIVICGLSGCTIFFHIIS
jgi:hypothetical protein